MDELLTVKRGDMSEHTESGDTPLRRSRRLGKGSRLSPTEMGEEKLAVLNEAEGAPSDVRTENGEDKDCEAETAMEVTAVPGEADMLAKEAGTPPTKVAATPEAPAEEEHLLLQGGAAVFATEAGPTPTEVAAPAEGEHLLQGGAAVLATEAGPTATEVAATPEAPAEGEHFLLHGGAAVLTKESGTAPTEVAATHVLIRDGSSVEKCKETRKPLESVSEPCQRPLLGVREQKGKSGSLSDKKGVPKGKPKSGRIWKDQNKKRFSGMVKDRPLHTSWDKKMAARREKSLMKDFAQRLKDEKRKAKEEKKQRREENLKRRLENERKAEVVQVITNLAKLKRAKKKQLRRIEKRDTLALAQRGSGLNKKAERLTQFLKKKKVTTEAKENTN